MRTISMDDQERASRAYDAANGRMHTSIGSIERRAIRGDRVEIGEARGRYVGRSRSRAEWIAWEGMNYLDLCNTFDAQVAPKRNASRVRFVSRAEQDRAARLYREACAATTPSP